MKKKFVTLLTLIATLLAFATTALAKPRVIEVTTKFVDNEVTAIVLKKVVENINTKSNGELQLNLHTSGSWSYGKEGMELVKRGADVILVDGINFIGDYIPDYNAITGPFLYSSFDQYFAVTGSDYVKAMNEKAYKQGIYVQSLNWVFGFRSMMTNKEIKTPEDMKGLRLRVPTSKLYEYTLKAMGATPIGMPYPDTYAAIQQKVIDGVEGSLLTYWGTKQYENVKNYSLTRHLLGVSGVFISKRMWESLTDSQRALIEEEFNKGCQEQIDETNKLEAEYIVNLQNEGVKINEVDTAAFSKAASVVFGQFKEWTPGIYDKIQEIIKDVK